MTEQIDWQAKQPSWKIWSVEELETQPGWHEAKDVYHTLTDRLDWTEVNYDGNVNFRLLEIRRLRENFIADKYTINRVS